MRDSVRYWRTPILAAMPIVVGMLFVAGIPTSTPTAGPVARASPVSGYATTWVGNSFGGGGYSDDGGNQHPYVPPDGQAIAVSSTGAVYLANHYDEGHRLLSKWQNGKLQGSATFYCLGWNSNVNGGYAVATNGSYVYMSVSAQGPSTGNCPSCPANSIQRYDMNLAASTFSRATGHCSNEVFLDNSSSTARVNKWIYGLAASRDELYVSDAYTNSIRVLDANTMAALRSFAFTSPGPIAYDPNTHTLWIVQTSTNTVYHYDLKGNRLSVKITSVAKPQGLAIQPGTGNLWVTDSGPDQDIKIFNTSGTQVGTFGTKGGVYANTEGGPGVVAPNKLLYPRGVGFDGSGNFYTLGGNWFLDDLRAFNSSQSSLWMIHGFGYVKSAAADPATDGRDVYMTNVHYMMNYNSLTTGAGGGGTEETWYGVTLDPFAYPDDPRTIEYMPTESRVLNINGHKYLAQSDMYSHSIILFRMNGEIAIPSLIISNNLANSAPWSRFTSNPFIWQDANGDGTPESKEFTSFSAAISTVDPTAWFIDNNGNIWFANHLAPDYGLNELPVHGIDSVGNLTYHATAVKNYGIPAPFNAVRRLYYDAANDVLYVSGYTSAIPFNSRTDDQYVAGPVLARYNHWSTGNRAAAWAIKLPWDDSSSAKPHIWIRPWTVTGGKIFAGLFETVNNKNSQAIHNIYVYDASTGAYLGEMMPGVETNGFMGWLDCNDVLQALQRADGEYLVFEEEEIDGKVTLMRGLLNTFTQY